MAGRYTVSKTPDSTWQPYSASQPPSNRTPQTGSETMIPRTEQLADARRALALRRLCYPRWIASGKLDAGEATYQLKAMQALIATLARLDAAARPLGLFGDHQDTGKEPA